MSPHFSFSTANGGKFPISKQTGFHIHSILDLFAIRCAGFRFLVGETSIMSLQFTLIIIGKTNCLADVGYFWSAGLKVGLNPDPAPYRQDDVENNYFDYQIGLQVSPLIDSYI